MCLFYLEREINASTRLSMYVLLKLLFANQELNCIRLNVFEFLNSPSDRRLLEVHLRPVNVGLLVAILKAFATHGMWGIYLLAIFISLNVHTGFIPCKKPDKY